MAGGENNIWIIANWKSNKDLSEALEWVSMVGPNIPKKENLKVVVCPQFSELEEVKKAILAGNFPLMVGSQDLSPFDQGPFTGEEAAKNLREFVDLAILGHSERRKNFAETDEMVAKKVLQAKKYGIIPLVCVQGKETPVPEECNLVAYEPIYAISTSGPNAHADDPTDTVKVARSFKEKYGDDLEVLYGGSVTSANVQLFAGQNDLNGVLVGGASLDAAHFIAIVKACTLIN